MSKTSRFKLKRLIFQNLKEWRQKKDRKPLILKGVRQTGKTYALKEFGKNNFSAFHYLNFEHNKKATELFKKDYDSKRILTDLSFLLDKTVDIKNDLIIFDEIQECPEALTSLKYFAEQMPELAVCCAGSLLGLHLKTTSFPVGKIDLLHLHPLCFSEFLEAQGDLKSLNLLSSLTQQDSISEIAHAHLWQQFKIYLVTGGLPEVVQTFLENKENLYAAFTLSRKKQNELIYGYYADIAKHSGKINAMHIDRVWRAIPNQLARAQNGSARRFQFKEIIPGVNRYQRLANVFDWLIAAELAVKIPVIEHVELPLAAYAEESRFKLYLFDVGILGALADLPPKSILDYEYGTYKGYFAENFVAQELIAKGIKNLYSWQDNRSEIEFLFVDNTHIIPIEVKSGWVTRNQSLNKYDAKYHPPYRAIFSAKTLYIDLENQYHQYPLYLAYWFPLYKVLNN
ncbi:MAG: family ATPase [Gammaproteobacteria bacterium]|jgi:predicted AAA+ superfamily ATPase|nr:family ATPase [Gammaproteobacteria bacterium]